MKTSIIIDNLNCAGCSGSTKKGLRSFSGVSDVVVDLEQESVEITHQDDLQIEKIREKLSAMGYPEKDKLDGFEKLAANARSYISCAVGKLSNDE